MKAISRTQFMNIGEAMRSEIPDSYERAAALLAALDRLGIAIADPVNSQEMLDISAVARSVQASHEIRA